MLVNPIGEGITHTPTTTTIKVKEHEQAGTAKNIVDLLKDSAAIDFRGSSDLVQDNDNVYMRGFGQPQLCHVLGQPVHGENRGTGGKICGFHLHSPVPDRKY